MSNGCSPPTLTTETPATVTFTGETAVPTFDGPTSGCEDTGGGGGGVAPGCLAVTTDEKEFQEDFDTVNHVLDEGSSIESRPDAISFDYLTSWSIGPRDLGDADFGPRDRVWRAICTNDPTTLTGSVSVQRANDDNTAWEDAVELFTFGGQATEMDLAFEQAGRAVIALEINGRIWLYWFDPTIPPSGEFTLTDFAAGRTPRVILDNPEDTTDSDVLLFYIGTDTDTVVLRQQRDRYATEYNTPYTGLANKFLEEALKTTDNRVAIIISERNTVTGRYSLDRIETTLYPFFIHDDDYEIGLEMGSGGSLEEAVLEDIELEEYDIDLSIVSGILAAILLTYIELPEEYDIDMTIVSGTLIVVVIEYVEPPDQEDYNITMAIQSGLLVLVIIDHIVYDPDSYDIGMSIAAGGSLVTV